MREGRLMGCDSSTQGDQESPACEGLQRLVAGTISSLEPVNEIF
jgi:hypothetical protein